MKEIILLLFLYSVRFQSYHKRQSQFKQRDLKFFSFIKLKDKNQSTISSLKPMGFKLNCDRVSTKYLL